MTTPSQNYLFDQWAEFLTVTLSENIVRCQRGNNKVKKVRLSLNADSNWPVTLKVILDNELIASSPQHAILNDGSSEIDYMYRTPTQIPFGTRLTDPVAKSFIHKAKSMDSNFLSDTWSLQTANSIPALLKQLAFRSIGSILPKELEQNGVGITEDFSLQFFNGSDYVSFSYDAIKQGLAEQIQFYFSNKKVKSAAAEICFKHPHNKKWFMALS